MKTNLKAASKKPPIRISESDYDRIADLALQLEHRNPELSALILSETDRARVYADAKLPADVVSLGAEVEFLDDSNGTRRRVTLVLPGEADIAEGKISIVTPVGAGLIGLAIGQSIDWPCPDGRPRTFTITDVSHHR